MKRRGFIKALCFAPFLALVKHKKAKSASQTVARVTLDSVRNNPKIAEQWPVMSYIELPEEIKQLTVFKDQLYALGENGMYVFTQLPDGRRGYKEITA